MHRVNTVPESQSAVVGAVALWMRFIRRRDQDAGPGRFRTAPKTSSYYPGG
jgi:hypothetical protein